MLFQKATSEERLFEITIKLILSGKIGKAYKEICYYMSELESSRGLNCDWRTRCRKGIPSDQKQLYSNFLRDRRSGILSATAIYSVISGTSIQNTCRYLQKSFETTISVTELDYETALLCTRRDFMGYINANISEYSFMGTLDTTTCQKCGELDGKIFPVKEMVVGVNCPPMHEGCRCTTVAHIPKYEILRKNTSRFARDPNTHKGVNVPATTTWTDWVKEIK